MKKHSQSVSNGKSPLRNLHVPSRKIPFVYKMSDWPSSTADAWTIDERWAWNGAYCTTWISTLRGSRTLQVRCITSPSCLPTCDRPVDEINNRSVEECVIGTRAVCARNFHWLLLRGPRSPANLSPATSNDTMRLDCRYNRLEIRNGRRGSNCYALSSPTNTSFCHLNPPSRGDNQPSTVNIFPFKYSCKYFHFVLEFFIRVICNAKCWFVGI